jgi:hypothetical protein
LHNSDTSQFPNQLASPVTGNLLTWRRGSQENRGLFNNYDIGEPVRNPDWPPAAILIRQPAG